MSSKFGTFVVAALGAGSSVGYFLSSLGVGSELAFFVALNVGVLIAVSDYIIHK